MWVFIVREEANVPADDKPKTMIKPLTKNQSNTKRTETIIADDTLHIVQSTYDIRLSK